MQKQKINLKLITIITLALIIVGLIYWLIANHQINQEKDTYLAQASQTQQQIYSNFQTQLQNSDKSAIDISLIGESFINQGQTELGLIALNVSLEKDNSIRDIALYTSKIYFDNHDYQKALELAQHAQELDPVYYSTYSLLTEIYTALGDEENSQICYNKSKEFNPENHQ